MQFKTVPKHCWFGILRSYLYCRTFSVSVNQILSEQLNNGKIMEYFLTHLLHYLIYYEKNMYLQLSGFDRNSI